jgi:dolichol-phosphate mannosyltransferase
MAARDMTRLKICLVIPAYNEERRISRTLRGLIGTLLKKYSGMTVIVSVQGDDRTWDIVKEVSRTHSRIKLLDCRGTRGKGINLIRGFNAALKTNPDIVGFADADSSVRPDQLEKLIDALGGGDGAIASRYIKGSRILGHLPPSRWLASRAYNLMVRLLFGLKFSDTQCGAKFFWSSALRSVMRNVRLTEMSFDINLLYEMERQGLAVREVPITYHMENEGSKVRVSRQIPRMLMVTVSYRIVRSPLNKLFPTGFKTALYNWVRSW